MPDEEKDLLRFLQELRLTEDVRPPRLGAADIANAQGDDQILNLLKQLLADLSESSLPSECDSLMERLSFTSRSVLPDRRPREWSVTVLDHDPRCAVRFKK